MTHHHTMMIETPRDALLQREVATLRVENKALKEENEQLKQHNAVLRLSRTQ